MTKDEALQEIMNNKNFCFKPEDFNYDIELITNSIISQKRYDLVKVLNDKKLITAQITKELVKRDIHLYPIINKKHLNKEICLHVLNKKPSFFLMFTNQMKADKDVALLAIKKDAENIKHINQELLEDEDIIKEAFAKNMYYMSWVPLHCVMKDNIIDFFLKTYGENKIKMQNPEYLDMINKRKREQYLLSELDISSKEFVTKKKKM